MKMVLIVASKRDVAGMNIARKLIENYGFKETYETFNGNLVYLKIVKNREVKLVFVNEEPIYTQFITEHFQPELIVYISRHSSRSGKPTLTVHTPGNLTEEASFGGIPRKISVSPASAMKNALKEMMRLKKEWNLQYEVSYECTHHGPSLDVPTMFVELGSTIVQWRDLKAAEAIAHAAMKAVEEQESYPALLGIGGPHYNRKFTKIALSQDVAFGHMIPKHVISRIGLEILKQCVDRTVEKVEKAVLDWKGIKGADKDKLLVMLEKIGLITEKIG